MPSHVSAPVLVYSACTCALMAMILAQAKPSSVADLFVLFFGSPVNTLIAFNFLLMVAVVKGQVICRLVFGNLSDEEISVVKELVRSFIMFKSVYVFSALHAAQYSDLAIWMTCFMVFGWLRAFVALGYHRLSHLDYMQSELNSKRKMILCFISACLFINILLIVAFTSIFSASGWRPLLLLLHEGGLTIIVAICSIVLYSFQVMDYMSSADHSQKAFYLDSIGEIIIQTLSLLLLLQVWAAYGLSLTVVDMFFFMIVRAIYLRVSSRLASMVAYRRVLNDINTRFADATEQELEGLDDHCAICHEQLQLGVTKKLPCSHFFHLSCLRQWMKYRRTCPICRSDLLNNSPPQPAGLNRPAPNQWGLRRLFHINTGNWASWMPNISFEVVRGVQVAPIARRGMGLLPSIRILSEMFPHVPDVILQRHLNQAHGNITNAIESLINDNNGLGNVNNGVEQEVLPEANGESSSGLVDNSEVSSSAPRAPEISSSEPRAPEFTQYSDSSNSTASDSSPVTSIPYSDESSSSLRRRIPQNSSHLDERRMAAIARIEALARGQQPPP